MPHHQKHSTCDVSQCSVFRNCSASHQKLLGSHIICNSHKQGELICKEGNIALGLFCLCEGKVKIFNTDVDGEEQIMYMAKSGGDVFGFYLGAERRKEEVYEISAVAFEDSKVCFIPLDAFFEVYYNDVGLIKIANVQIFKMLRFSRQVIMSLGKHSALQRVARSIILIKNHYGVMAGKSQGIIDVPFSRRDLANLIGTTEETVIRIIGKLRKQKIIATVDGRIQILDETRLRKIAKLPPREPL